MPSNHRTNLQHQTGQFPISPSRGMKYLLFLYNYDSNYIVAKPMPSQTQHQILKAYRKLVMKLQHRGLKPKLQRLDNEASQAFQDEMVKPEIDYQLTPADLHQSNAVEKAVETFKNHFISGLCNTDPQFPLNL